MANELLYMKLFRRAYFPKIIIGSGLLIQFLAIFVLVLWASTKISTDPQVLAQNVRLIILIVLVIFVVDCVLSLIILNSESAEVYKLTWIFFVFALPILGILLYLLIANKATSKRNRKRVQKYLHPIQNVPSLPETKKELGERFPYFTGLASYLETVSRGGVHQQTSVHYYGLVDDAFQPILEELKKAKHYIFMEFFIVGEGKFFGSIVEILKEKAKAGVDVRVIYDDVGSLSSIPYGYDEKLRKEGIKCVIYNKFRPFMDIRMNNRDHRKIMVIDGHTCFTGGFNIADEYINAEERFGHWKDNAILIKGRAVENFTTMFLALWNSISPLKEEIDKSYYASEKFIDEIGGFPASDGFVQPYTSLPFDGQAVGERVYINICNLAKKYLYIATPYLIIDQEMANAIMYAAHHGVEVRLLTPHIPDKATVFQITRSFYGPLLKAGVKVYEYTPGFVHEKVFIADDEIATCGTINLDYRSLYLHLECGTLLMGCAAVEEMRKDYLQTLDLCHQVQLEEWEHWEKRNKTYWGSLRLFAPLL